MSSGTAKGCFRIQQYVISLVHYIRKTIYPSTSISRKNLQNFKSLQSQRKKILICPRTPKIINYLKFVLVRIRYLFDVQGYFTSKRIVLNNSRILLNCSNWKCKVQRIKKNLSKRPRVLSQILEEEIIVEESTSYWSKNETLAKSKV